MAALEEFREQPIVVLVGDDEFPARLGEQEVAMMSLVAACQARQWSLARRIAGCLVSVDGVGAAIAAASGVADIMKRHLPALPLRLATDTDDLLEPSQPGGPVPTGAMALSDVTIH